MVLERGGNEYDSLNLAGQGNCIWLNFFTIMDYYDPYEGMGPAAWAGVLIIVGIAFFFYLVVMTIMRGAAG